MTAPVCLLVALLGGVATAPASQALPGGVLRAQPGRLPRQGLPRQGQAMPPLREQMRPRLHPGIEMRSYVFEPTGERLEYALFVPRKISREKQPAALIIALHGLNVPPALMANGLAESADRHGYIVVAPTGYRLNGWYGYVQPAASEENRRIAEFSELDVMNVLDVIRQEYNIDERRIYLVGSSMGGTGVLHLARKYPGMWAAVAALAPGVPDAGRDFERARETPVLVMTGDRDQLLPIEGTRNAVARLREAGISIEYHEIRGGDHTAPDRAGIPAVFSFLDKHGAAP